jgi:pimeloyl-ACP methyl ester carboxylesterase
VPPSECTVHINYDLNTDLPGYWVEDPDGTTCVPFVETVNQPPEGYEGNFYVDEFTDAAIKAKWEECKQDPACEAGIRGALAGFGIPHQFHVTGTADPFGKIEPEVDVDLAGIRRPAYFARSPYYENIAKLDDKTYTVEFTVPREPYEQIHMGLTDPIKLRGWFIQGDGIEGANGERVHAIVILMGGRSIETTATQDPNDPLYEFKPFSRTYSGITYPRQGSLTEKWGVRQWRQYMYALNQAGFDVFTWDKRGHGISGGRNDWDTMEQGEDIFRGLDALETGEGLRLLTPEGDELSGADAAGLLLRGMQAKEVPVIVGGPSQGSMVTGWVMMKNFGPNCDFHLLDAPCSEPKGYNIKAAILLAPFTGGSGFDGLGYGGGSRWRVEGAMRAELNVVFWPSSDVLVSMPNWSGAFFGRGLWDAGESLQGTLTSYQSVNGLKQIVVVRGPHSENEYGPVNLWYMKNQIVAFAKAAVLDQTDLGIPVPDDVKDVVESSIPFWEPSMVPTYR